MGLNGRELRNLVQVQRRVDGRNDANEPNGDWQTIRECWAKIVAKPSGNTQKRYQDETFTPVVESLITVRWSRSVQIVQGDRIVYLNKGNNVTHIYDVRAVTNREQRNYALDILAWETQPTE